MGTSGMVHVAGLSKGQLSTILVVDDRVLASRGWPIRFRRNHTRADSGQFRGDYFSPMTVASFPQTVQDGGRLTF